MERGAAFTLALVGRWRRGGILQESRCPSSVDAADLAAAPDLMQQDLSSRKTVGALIEVTGSSAASGPGDVARRLVRRLSGRSRQRHDPDRSGTVDHGYASWFADRAGQDLAAITRKDVRYIARASRDLGDWLDGTGDKA